MNSLIKSLVVLSFVLTVYAPAIAATDYCQKEATYFESEAKIHVDASVESARYLKNPTAFNEEEMTKNDRFAEFTIKCSTKKQAIASMQRELRRLYNETIQLTALAERACSCQTQPTITVQPTQPTQPAVSNNIHCSTSNVNGTVYTDCN